MSNPTKKELLEKSEQANSVIRDLAGNVWAGLCSDEYGGFDCVYCHHLGWFHTSECPITRARILLGWDSVDATVSSESRIDRDLCLYLRFCPMPDRAKINEKWQALKLLSAKPENPALYNGVEMCLECAGLLSGRESNTTWDFGPVAELPRCPHCGAFIHKWLNREGVLAALESWEKRELRYDNSDDVLLMLCVIDGLQWYWSDSPQTVEFARSILGAMPSR